MDSGLKKIVFVARDKGFFEPRRVKTGWRLGERAEIVEGLKPGERIVVSGNFLIDSETRMQLAVAGMGRAATKNPVGDRKVDASQAKSHQGPERLAAKPEAGSAYEPGASSPKTATPAMAQDPACGLTVAQEEALQAGRTSRYQGKTYYFDTDGCKRRFDQDPQRYLVTGSGKKVTSSVNLESYPTVPMDPATQDRDRRQGNFRIPPRPSRAMPHGAPMQKGLAGGLPLGTVMTEPHGGTPAGSPAAPSATPQGPAPVQTQPQHTPPDPPSKP